MILELLLAATVVIPNPDAPVDCSAYGPTHTSGAMLTQARRTDFPVPMLDLIYKDVRSPSMTVLWGAGRCNDAILAFLESSYHSSDRELTIVMTKAALENDISFTTQIDAIVNTIAGSGWVDLDLGYGFDRADIKLVLSLEDNLTNARANDLVLLAENFWPWTIVRNPSKRNGEIVSRAGADLLRIHDYKISTKTLGANMSLEYQVANYKNVISERKLLSWFRKHYLSGAVDIEVWLSNRVGISPGLARKYNRIIKRLDRWAYSEVPSECLPGDV